LKPEEANPAGNQRFFSASLCGLRVSAFACGCGVFSIGGNAAMDNPGMHHVSLIAAAGAACRPLAGLSPPPPGSGTKIPQKSCCKLVRRCYYAPPLSQ